MLYGSLDQFRAALDSLVNGTRSNPRKRTSTKSRKSKKREATARRNTTAKFGSCCACANPFVPGEPITKTTVGWAHPNCGRMNPDLHSRTNPTKRASKRAKARQASRDYYGVAPLPQMTKKEEMRALVRRNPQYVNWTAYPEWAYAMFWRGDQGVDGTAVTGSELPVESPSARVYSLQACGGADVPRSAPRQFHRRNPNRGATIPIEYGVYNVFQRYWWGQGDPLYAVLSRRGSSVDIVKVKASAEELARLQEVAHEILETGDDQERYVAQHFLYGSAEQANKARKNSGVYKVYDQMPDNAGPYTPKMYPYGMFGRPASYTTEPPQAKANPPWWAIHKNPASKAVQYAITSTGNTELARDALWFEKKKKEAKAAKDAWGVEWWSDRLKVAKAEIKRRQKTGTWHVRAPKPPTKKTTRRRGPKRRE